MVIPCDIATATCIQQKGPISQSQANEAYLVLGGTPPSIRIEEFVRSEAIV
jgi:hypothetical protein